MCLSRGGGQRQVGVEEGREDRREKKRTEMCRTAGWKGAGIQTSNPPQLASKDDPSMRLALDYLLIFLNMILTHLNSRRHWDLLSTG